MKVVSAIYYGAPCEGPTSAQAECHLGTRLNSGFPSSEISSEYAERATRHPRTTRSYKPL